jgi:hypothetical protein
VIGDRTSRYTGNRRGCTQVVHSAADSEDQLEAFADANRKDRGCAWHHRRGTMPMTGPEVLSIASAALDEIQRLKIREVPAP